MVFWSLKSFWISLVFRLKFSELFPVWRANRRTYSPATKPSLSTNNKPDCCFNSNRIQVYEWLKAFGEQSFILIPLAARALSELVECCWKLKWGWVFQAARLPVLLSFSSPTSFIVQLLREQKLLLSCFRLVNANLFKLESWLKFFFAENPERKFPTFEPWKADLT